MDAEAAADGTEFARHAQIAEPRGIAPAGVGYIPAPTVFAEIREGQLKRTLAAPVVRAFLAAQRDALLPLNGAIGFFLLKSFLLDSQGSMQARAIIRAILSLGQSLAMPVLAEGLETEEQLAWLRQEGCDQAQGYLLGRPHLNGPEPLRSHAA